jgi:hypothetical protein
MAFDRSVVIATSLSLRRRILAGSSASHNVSTKASLAVLRRSSAPTTNVDCG